MKLVTVYISQGRLEVAKLFEIKSKIYTKKWSIGPQKLSFFTPSPIIMAFLSIYRWQNNKERPNWSANNEDIAEIAKLNDGVTK